MKLIHTSDWHFGQTLRGHDRTKEHECFITQLIKYINLYQPDALLVSGDLYDNGNSNSETDLFFRSQILRIRQSAPNMHIIMIAGNHDGYAKQEADSTLWQLGGITVVGHIAIKNGTVDYNRHIINLDNKAYILPIPFTRFFPPIPENDDISQRKTFFYNQLLSKVAELNTNQLPVIMMGHLNYEGAEIAEQESLVRGGEDPTKEQELGSGYDYLAMGHIHYPQTHGRARYAGSPIPINFSEAYQHSVSLIEINKHTDMPLITELPIQPLYGMKKLIQKQGQSLHDFLLHIDTHIGNNPNYIRLGIIRDKAPESHNSDSDIELILNAFFEQHDRLIYCGYDILPSTDNSQSDTETTTYTPQQLENNDPLELANLYYKETTGSDLSKELRELMQQAVNNIENYNKSID